MEASLSSVDHKFSHIALNELLNSCSPCRPQNFHFEVIIEVFAAFTESNLHES